MRPIIVSEWDRYLAASTSGKKCKLIVVLVYAMRTSCSRIRGTATLILNLGTRLRCVVNVTLPAALPPGKNPGTHCLDLAWTLWRRVLSRAAIRTPDHPAQMLHPCS
jgi:hypothetical protein